MRSSSNNDGPVIGPRLRVIPGITHEQAVHLVEVGKRSPEWWVRNILGSSPLPYQVQIMNAVRDHKRVAVRSCHGIGKDWTAAATVLWFLYNHPRSIVITTGPTDRQVRGILWKEIAIAYHKAPVKLRGVLLSQELKLDRDWWAWGFTAPSRDPDRFQGFHASDVLVVIDEASGVSDEIYTAIDGVLSSANARRLEIANPTTPVGPFARSFATPGVHKISISAFDTPNFTSFGLKQEDFASGEWRSKMGGREVPYPFLVTPEWVDELYHRPGVGPDSPIYRSRVLAEFPVDAKDALIPYAWIMRAIKVRRPHVESGEVELGVDVARTGQDSTVIVERRGQWARVYEAVNGLDTMAVAGRVAMAMDDTGASVAKIDVVGIGAGVYDRLKELGKNVLEANAGSSANDTEKFANARAQWYWSLRERFELEEISIEGGDSADQILADLSATQWRPDSRGRVMIQPKEEIKKKTGRSPDYADALAIAFAAIEGPSQFAFA